MRIAWRWWRTWSSRRTARSLESDIYRAQVHNRAKLAYRSVAAWLDGQGPAPQRVQEVAGLEENLRLQDRMAQQLANLRQAHGALGLETIEARAVFDGDAISGLELERKNRAKQLIEDFMIAANGATAAYLEAKKFPSLRRVLRSPERWERIAQLAAPIRHATSRRAGFRRAGGIPRAAAERGPGDIPGPVAGRREAGRKRRIRGERAGRAGAGAFRAGGAGLHPLDGAEPAFPGRDHATAAESGDGGRGGALCHRATERARRALHHAGGRGDESRAPDAEVGRGAAAVRADWRAVSRRSSPGRRRREPGCAFCSLRWKAGWSVACKGSMSATTCSVKLLSTDVQRGFIDFDADLIAAGARAKRIGAAAGGQRRLRGYLISAAISHIPP